MVTSSAPENAPMGRQNEMSPLNPKIGFTCILRDPALVVLFPSIMLFLRGKGSLFGFQKGVKLLTGEYFLDT